MSPIHIKTRPYLTDPRLFNDYPDFIARFLARRGLQSTEELKLHLQHLLQPNLKGLEQAVEIINQAIDLQKSILIVGDYDADGATSTTLMVLALREMGATVNYIVPDRFKYGYGLTPAIADLAYQSYQPDLLITVDNGISSHDGVAQAQAYGIKVVITDHHLTTKPTPDAEAVVNPNQLGCEFPSKSLAGVGVAFYVLARLSRYRQNLGKSHCKITQYLDLVALGTYADVASLDHNNRILIDAGLKRIQQGQCRLGILALLQIAKRTKEQFTAQDFGFVLGPRLNAAGRMDNMQIGIECLLAEDWHTAYGLAERLNQLNIDRRQIEQQMKEQALKDIEHLQLNEQDLPPALVMYQPNFHQGVIGIVAGRLKDLYHLPSIVFADDVNPNLIKGSARSIDGIHIRDTIERVAEQSPHLVKYFGGHAAAAGLTIEKQYFDEFKSEFCRLINQYDESLFEATLWTDGELSTDELNLTTIDLLNTFAPYGHKFPAPIFHGTFQIQSFQWLKEQHLKLFLQLDNSTVLEAISFHAKSKWDFNPNSEQVFLVYELNKNEFQGNVRLQLNVLFLQSTQL